MLSLLLASFVTFFVAIDPVAMAFDALGQLWVVEMRDYPLGMNNKGEPGGRVVYLEDTNGDGRYDKSTMKPADEIAAHFRRSREAM